MIFFWREGGGLVVVVFFFSFFFFFRISVCIVVIVFCLYHRYIPLTASTVSTKGLQSCQTALSCNKDVLCKLTCNKILMVFMMSECYKWYFGGFYCLDGVGGRLLLH